MRGLARTLTTRVPVGMFVVAACASDGRRFPLREPVWRDTDLQSVRARCHAQPTDEDPRHVSCAPEPYDGTLYWDGADQMVLRPLSQMVGLSTGTESVDVNSLDEVPDSAWFTNRIGFRPMSSAELRQNACPADKLLDPETAKEGSWVIDKGKTFGSTPGFRMKVPGKGKYLVKLEAHRSERQVAASVIGEAVYYAAGYNASCEQALWVRPSVFKLTPGLTSRRGNFGDLYPFDEKALRELMQSSTMRDGLLRVSASAWIPGYGLGQFRYDGTRDDDPNDVVPHEDRRELRGARLLAAWIGDVDCREGNSFDTWMADAPGGPPDSSPGHVVHYQIGTSAALGNVWDSDELSRRLGYSYLVDWGDMATSFLLLGAVSPAYERVQKKPGQEIFGYWNVEDFEPEQWKNEYPNPAFDRATERDAAWMARILARFTPDLVHTLVEMTKLSDPANAAYLESVLNGRLAKILARYLGRLSPIGELYVDGSSTLCGTDLAEWRGLRDARSFRYGARLLDGRGGWLRVERRPGGGICASLPHVAPDGSPSSDDPARYVRVRIEDGFAPGPLVAHLYDLGPARGYRLAGVVRPDR
ncbi:MAG TPA: hypothetical protein VKU41_07630 [Polyangiaceae bacterium]|nr:hypothetical protein [Polyangiaceae bacterium]